MEVNNNTDPNQPWSLGNIMYVCMGRISGQQIFTRYPAVLPNICQTNRIFGQKTDSSHPLCTYTILLKITQCYVTFKLINHNCHVLIIEYRYTGYKNQTKSGHQCLSWYQLDMHWIYPLNDLGKNHIEIIAR